MITRVSIFEKGRKAGRGQEALTILEMLVSSAMLALIIVGLTAMFVQTQKAFKLGVRQTDVSDTGRSTVDELGAELAQLSDGVANGVANSQNFGVTNLLWGWEGNYKQIENGVTVRTNLLQSIYILMQTNTGWTAVGYTVSNLAPGLGIGTLYRYTSQTNGYYIDNRPLLEPFLAAFSPNFMSLCQQFDATNSVRLDRIADGVVDLRIVPYDQYGNLMDSETNAAGGLLSAGPWTNTLPHRSNLRSQSVSNSLPTSVDVELGIVDPDTWDHLRSLNNVTAEQNYLQSAAAKIEIFHKRVLVRAAGPP